MKKIDPCPLPKQSLTCKNCTGKYIQVKKSRTTLKGRTDIIEVSVMVKTGGEECPIKEVARRADESIQADRKRMVD